MIQEYRVVHSFKIGFNNIEPGSILLVNRESKQITVYFIEHHIDEPSLESVSGLLTGMVDLALKRKCYLRGIVQ